MSISGLSGLSASYSFAQTAGTQHRQPKELEDLQSALQSGDITGAQQALAAFQQHAPGGQQTQTASANSSGDSVITDISALGKALSAGDLSGAQDAFSTLQTDLQNNPPPPPGGPRGSDGGQGDQVQSLFGQLADALQSGDLASAQDAFNSLQELAPNKQADSSSATAGANPFSDDISALSDALSSGDLSAAQDAFATLQQDIQSNPPPPPPGGPRGADSGQGDQVQSLFSQLADALKSGDLSGAQDAFDALQKLGGDQGQSTQASSTSAGSNTGSSTSSSFGDDISALSDALSSGDLSSAQDAFATLLEDLKAQTQNRHLLDYTQIAALSDSSSSISTSA